MNQSNPSEPSTPIDPQAALFASMVVQQTNLALVFLGKSPHPETGAASTDLDAASLVIDTLEMLAAKTQGNLSKPESDLLQNSLTSLRLQFVAAVDAAPHPSPPPPPSSPTPAPDSTPAAAAAEDARKKFVKHY